MARLLTTAMTLGVAAAALALPAAPADAQAGKVTEVIVYGSDACPRSSDDNVVVCARRPEAERYRIPEQYRKGGSRQARQSWGRQAETLETVGATGINSCSAVGPAGHTGCLQKMIQQARKERQAAARGEEPSE